MHFDTDLRNYSHGKPIKTDWSGLPFYRSTLLLNDCTNWKGTRRSCWKAHVYIAEESVLKNSIFGFSSKCDKDYKRGDLKM